MVLQIGEQSNEVQWHLHFHVVEVPDNKLWDVETHCYVHTGPCIMTAMEPRYCINGSRGVARCSKKDRYVKRVGTRLALTKAIGHLPEATRECIWKAYWLRVRRPKEDSQHFKARTASSTTSTQPQQPQASV